MLRLARGQLTWLARKDGRDLGRVGHLGDATPDGLRGGLAQRVAGRPGCPAPSCGGTARSPRRPWPRCARPVGWRSRAGHRCAHLPVSGCSRPAISRSAVVLPQPDGPTMTMNSPSAISRLKSWTASTSPYRFDTCSRLMPRHHAPPPQRRGRRRRGSGAERAPGAAGLGHEHSTVLSSSTVATARASDSGLILSIASLQYQVAAILVAAGALPADALAEWLAYPE